MRDIRITRDGVAGRITLNRLPELNAMTHEMCNAIVVALDTWRSDPEITLVIFDAMGQKAFCAGGDIVELYTTGQLGNFAYGQNFWRDEYRLNAKIKGFPKPVISFMQGFIMGGGVGLGCHGSHRVVGDSSQIAMPECGIGLVPDVGGSLILANAPGRLGEYLGTTGARLNAGDAIMAGFADHYIPEEKWPVLIKALGEKGDCRLLFVAAQRPPEGPVTRDKDHIDCCFSGDALVDIINVLRSEDTPFSQRSLKALGRNSPLSMACEIEMIHRLRGTTDIRKALELEYRFTYRAMEHGDFLEGIRAAIIDKDRTPHWQHQIDEIPLVAVSRMLLPLGAAKLTFEEVRMKIGFIGLGNMGAPMAAKLIKAGYQLTGYDTADIAIDGMVQGLSAVDAVTDAELVITMLPNGSILRAVAAKVLPAMRSGAVFVDCSTVDVDSARAVAKDASGLGITALDAPVSGGTGGAVAGSLTFMVGGSDDGFAVVKPLLEIMGQKAVHCGPAGNGQSAKICNNMILGVTMIATCEAFALADKLGLDRQAMFDVVSTSSGYSWSMNTYCPAPGIGPNSPADNGYKPGFSCDLMLKDLRLSQHAAQAVDADTPLGQVATELYRRFVEDEDGQGQDFSAMLPRFVRRGRTE